MFNIPVALIFFNRPQKIKEVFDVIKIIKPTTLLLIQDGPRENCYDDDFAKIAECRKIVEEVDWDCTVLKNYSEVNLGCGLRPASGITWAFENVEECIILEDDCVPDISFFHYCEQMLHKYKDNHKVMLISGMNLLGSYECEESYLFSQACTIGAWATWKRVWEKYDFEIKCFDECDFRKRIKEKLKNKKMRWAKFSAWDMTRRKLKAGEKLDWWDYQFHLQLFMNDGVGIIPKYNLIKNIGFGEDATNVADEEAAHFNLEVVEFPKDIVHPSRIECCNKFDQILFDKQFKDVSVIRVLLSFVKRTIKYRKI